MSLILAVVLGIVLLLTLILWLRIPAFIALLISSIAAGLFAGQDAVSILKTVQSGMGSTLGFVAVVVGLGAMLGAILEKTNGAQSIAKWMLSKFGTDRAPLAMVITGFIVAIPVFFDVAFIILIPIIYALQRTTGRSLLLYGIPLLAGLAITHSFIPPTPGPVAVADILGADIGWVIMLGLLAGIPTAAVSGLLYGKYISTRIMLSAPDLLPSDNDKTEHAPPFFLILSILIIPIVLILLGTMTSSGLIKISQRPVIEFVTLLGHPFVALIIANLVAWYVLGIKRGFSSKALFTITSKSMEPAGTIILLTGAGGVFKQVLVDTGAGAEIAQSFSSMGLSVIVFGFLVASIVRVVQGSATVAMITAAGLVAPILESSSLSHGQLAAIVIAIASGSSIFSHVNDSGFWLVKEYFGMDEKQTFRSWTVMTTLLALTGFISSLLLFYLF